MESTPESTKETIVVPSTYEEFKYMFYWDKFLSKKESAIIDEYVSKFIQGAAWKQNKSGIKEDEAREPWIFQTMENIVYLKYFSPILFYSTLASCCEEKLKGDKIYNSFCLNDEEARSIRAWLKKYGDILADLREGRKNIMKLPEYSPEAFPFMTGLTLAEYDTLCDHFDKLYHRCVELIGPADSRKKISFPIKLFMQTINLEEKLKNLVDYSILGYSLIGLIQLQYGRIVQDKLLDVAHFMCFWGFEKRNNGESYYDVGERIRQNLKAYQKRFGKLQIPRNIYIPTNDRTTYTKIDWKNGRIVYKIQKKDSIKIILGK